MIFVPSVLQWDPPSTAALGTEKNRVAIRLKFSSGCTVPTGRMLPASIPWHDPCITRALPSSFHPPGQLEGPGVIRRTPTPPALSLT